MAIAYISLGLSYILGPTARTRVAGFKWLPVHWNADELGWIWVLCATVAVAGVIWARTHTWLEPLAFGALITPPSAWAFIFLTSWVLGENPSGWMTALIYTLLTAITLHASSWPDPSRKVRPCPPPK